MDNVCNHQELPPYVRYEQDKGTEEDVGPGGVPKGAKTSDYYRTKDLPDKFEHPDCFKGYGVKQPNPLFRTTNSEYGSQAPNVHTMPVMYASSSSAFTDHLGKSGMYRNRSLNCGMDKSRVPD